MSDVAEKHFDLNLALRCFPGPQVAEPVRRAAKMGWTTVGQRRDRLLPLRNPPKTWRHDWTTWSTSVPQLVAGSFFEIPTSSDDARARNPTSEAVFRTALSGLHGAVVCGRRRHERTAPPCLFPRRSALDALSRRFEGPIRASFCCSPTLSALRGATDHGRVMSSPSEVPAEMSSTTPLFPRVNGFDCAQMSDDISEMSTENSWAGSVDEEKLRGAPGAWKSLLKR
eukprot:scaffold1484_cov241-Pinguiococcus_pyrenoidosus.AAC.25